MVDGNFDGAPVSDSLALELGPGVAGDSYASPHVMACCPEYDMALPNCELAHEQFCVADLVEQGSKSMESNLRGFADDAFGGAFFVVTSEGMSGVVNATNETPIVFMKTADDGWASSAFTLGHEDGLGHWTLVVAPAQWQ